MSTSGLPSELECISNVIAHAQKPDFRLSAKRTSPFKAAGGRQFSRLMAAEVCASAVIMLGIACSEVVWRVLATHCICQFPLHSPYRASPCAITFQLDSTLMWANISCLDKKRPLVAELKGMAAQETDGSAMLQWLPYSLWTAKTRKPHDIYSDLLKTKRSLFYIKTQSVPHCKHVSSRLEKPISLCCKWHKFLFVLR